LAESLKISEPGRRAPRPTAQKVLDVTAVAAALVAIAALLLEYGFYALPRWAPLPLLVVLEALAAAALLGESIGRCLLAPDRLRALRRRWAHVAAPLAAVAAALMTPDGGSPALAAVQAFALAEVVIHGLALYLRLVGSGIAPAHLLMGSFVFLILLGTGLLQLPRAVGEGERPLYFDQALFTATSATCVTGLVVHDTGEFSLFGQTVILCLIQLGGLGIMIFGTLFLLFLRRQMGIRQAAVVGEVLNEASIGRITRVIKFVVLSTLAIEAVGALLLAPLWRGQPNAAFATVFHSVSAFCNAGFSLQRDSFASEAMRNHWRVLLVVPVLIIIGGIGFPVLMDVLGGLPGSLRYLLRRAAGLSGVRRPRWTLHTKIVLVTTALLIVFGTAGVLAVEPGAPKPKMGQASYTEQELADRQTDWRTMSTPRRVRHAWFQAVSARTAGFNTMNLNHLSPAGKLWLIALMTIGGSPASTAGGMKTVTFAILLLLVWASLRRREQVEAFGRSLSVALLRRAVALAVLFVALVAVTTLLLAAVQGPTARFVDVLFESVSACGTVGLSLGQTPRLTLGGRYVIIGAMFIGRVGPLTLLMSLTGKTPPVRYRYPEEDVVIG